MANGCSAALRWHLARPETRDPIAVIDFPLERPWPRYGGNRGQGRSNKLFFLTQNGIR